MEKNRVEVRKGAWTKEEDILLKNCIEKFGEGKWHKVPPRAGLNRCRKSCRLRWLNYLRPNIKRGYFTKDEIDLLLRLHKLLGNRWSLIAGRLPGRTANDVKNFWNTHILKKSSLLKDSEKLTGEIKTISENNVTIKPRPRSLSKSHVPIYSSEEVTNKTNETKVSEKKKLLLEDQPNGSKNSVEFSLTNNNVLSEEEVSECIRWWLQTAGDGDEQTPVVSFSDKGDGDGDGAFMEPVFSPTQIYQKVTEFSSASFDADVFDRLTNFDY